MFDARLPSKREAHREGNVGGGESVPAECSRRICVVIVVVGCLRSGVRGAVVVAAVVAIGYDGAVHGSQLL